MDARSEGDFLEVNHLLQITSDAVALCARDGSIVHANKQLCDLMCAKRLDIVGSDIKDVLYSETFERASDHRFPFTLDGTETRLMLKLPDGSFVPVKARATNVASRRMGIIKKTAPYTYVAISSLEEQYSRDRQMHRVLMELQAANKRLSGTLSVIMSAVRARDLQGLIDTVLNKLSNALDAMGATLYFSETSGFKLRGVSAGLLSSYVPEYVPYGSGIPTHVLRKQSACRIQIDSGTGASHAEASFMDLDTRVTSSLRMQDMPPFKTMIAVPVFFGTQILGIVELGWSRPMAPRTYDVHVLEVVCDYLSIQLVSLVGSVRSQRTSELTASLNRSRDALFSIEGDAQVNGKEAFADMVREICRTLTCHACPVAYDAQQKGYMVDFEGGSRAELPGDPESLFFSSTAPMPRVASIMDDHFAAYSGAPSMDPDDLKIVRLTRVDASSRAGSWLELHGLPNQGVYLDFSKSSNLFDEDGESPSDSALVGRDDASFIYSQRLLLLRDSTQEPIDDLEFDYLLHIAHDFEQICHGETQKNEDRHIAQTLQVGMRSSLGNVPGIASDSLYSSATSSALVGGDFYTLLRLPDDQAVMILGDVSGKGVEAASMSALVKTALTAYAWEGAGPARMARSLNSMLMGFSRVETFATMFIAKIDLRRHRATYCSAGHPPTMLVHPAGTGGGDGADAPARAAEAEFLSCQSGVVGAFEGMAYENGSFTFTPGDILFMYTDGAIEARDSSGKFFGENRLRDFLLDHASAGVSGLCSIVLDELDAFTDSALDDDIALVALQFE